MMARRAAPVQRLATPVAVPTPATPVAAPVQVPEDESVSETATATQPVSIIEGGGGGGGGGGPDGAVDDRPAVASPEEQAAQITADSAQSEQQVDALAAARRADIAGRFGAARGRVTGVLASSSAGIQAFLTARQSEVQAASSSVIATGQALLASSLQSAQGQVQQARAVLDGVARTATAGVEGQVNQAAVRISSLVDAIPLPNLPGVSAIRTAAKGLAGRAASAVTAGLTQVRSLISTVLQHGASLLGSLLSAAGQAANSALSRVGAMIQQGIRGVFAGLSRLGTAVIAGLRRALDGTVLAGLRRAESTLTGQLATAQRQAVTSIRSNRDQHLQAVREGRTAADGGADLAEQARQNNASVVTLFRDRSGGVLGSIFDAVAAGAAALTGHVTSLVGRVIDLVSGPLSQIIGGLRQVGQAVSGFFSSLLADVSAGISTVVGFVRTAVQDPVAAVGQFASGAISRAGQFFAGLGSRLLGGNFSLPGVSEVIGGVRASGPIIKPPPGTIVKPVLAFLALLFAAVGAIVLYFAPSLVAAVAAALVALGIHVAPLTLLVIIGVLAVAALALALLLLYLLYQLVKPGPKPPPPVITHATDFAAPDGSASNRNEVGVGERVVFTGSAAGSWRASAGTPRSGSGPTFTWTAPERRKSVTIRLTVGRGTASAKLGVVEPNGIIAHKVSEQPVPPGQLGAGMNLDFEFHPLKVSFGNASTREVEGPASGITGYYRQFTKAFLRHNPGPVHFFPIGQNNRLTPGTTDNAGWIGQPPPPSDGRFHWVIPNKFRVVTESGDGKRYTNVIQEFIMEASGKAHVNKATAHVEHP